MKCMNVPKGFNNAVSSLKFYRTEWGAVAQGDWIAITATEIINFEYSIGFEKSSSTETTDTQKYDLSMQMTEGIEELGVSESETVTESYSHTITLDATQSMKYSTSEKYST